MAILIALIFQILFVLFAMVINVGLVVHDKINLQNSADIAAYYAAAKQAQLLGAIAHENYQIRQAWKLLAWRLRVLGDNSRRSHPAFISNETSKLEAPYHLGDSVPSVCIASSFWSGKSSRQNLCHEARIRIPKFQELTLIPGLFGPLADLNERIAGIVKDAGQVIEHSCQTSGSINWAIAATWMISYRLEVGSRLKTIRALAAEVARSPEDFTDLDGRSAREGAEKTLSNNLTRANLEDYEFEIFNSFGGIPFDRWLKEIEIYPTVLYTDFSNTAGGCSGQVKPLWQGLPNFYNANKSKIDPQGILADLYLEPPKSSPYKSLLGVEKNPWIMGYVGVKITSKPRKPFAPFGKPITLTAVSYAKPFGGRIGPWMNSLWPYGSEKSSGGEKLEPLTPERYEDGAPQEFTSSSVPNYSRFPGDALGLNSRLALSLFASTFQKVTGMTTDWWGLLPASFESKGSDPLAWALKPQLNRPLANDKSIGPWIRDLEISAVAPDLFDSTYYSVDPSFDSNYRQRMQQGILKGQFILGDLGTRDEVLMNIRDQMDFAVRLSDPQTNFYLLKSYHHLLTGWSPTGPSDFRFPASFGECYNEGKDPIPGSCAIGSRVGYSVKIVSHNYLTRKDLELGGPSVKGAILNPPPF